MDIEIYDIDEEAFKYYKENTKRGKDNDMEIARKKFTAMIMNACEVKDMELGSIIYKFGNFNMVVKYGEKKVNWVYWSDKKLYVSPEKSQQLHDTYKLLGLTDDEKNTPVVLVSTSVAQPETNQDKL